MAMLNNQRVNGSFESIEIEHDRSEHYKARPNQTPFLDPVEHSILTWEESQKQTQQNSSL
jgi:hypothetical protein